MTSEPSPDFENEFEENFELTDSVKQETENKEDVNICLSSFDDKKSEDIDQELLDFVDIIIHDNLEEFELNLIQKNNLNAKKTAGKELKLGDKKRIQEARARFGLEGLLLAKMKVYNALTDPHLQAFLSFGNRKDVLIKNGLLDEKGNILNREFAILKQKNMETEEIKIGKKSESGTKTTKVGSKSPYEEIGWALRDRLLKGMYNKKKEEAKNKHVASRVYEVKKDTKIIKKEIKIIEKTELENKSKNCKNKIKIENKNEIVEKNDEIKMGILESTNKNLKVEDFQLENKEIRQIDKEVIPSTLESDNKKIEESKEEKEGKKSVEENESETVKTKEAEIVA